MLLTCQQDRIGVLSLTCMLHNSRTAVCRPAGLASPVNISGRGEAFSAGPRTGEAGDGTPGEGGSPLLGPGEVCARSIRVPFWPLRFACANQ